MVVGGWGWVGGTRVWMYICADSIIYPWGKNYSSKVYSMVLNGVLWGTTPVGGSIYSRIGIEEHWLYKCTLGSKGSHQGRKYVSVGEKF